MTQPAVKSPADADAAFAAGQKVVETHRAVSAWLRPGVTLAQVDAFVGKTLDALGCRSCFLGYKVPRTPAFPSHACLSVNECVVHGTAGYYTAPMKAGDVLKIDIGVWHRGWIGDAAWTYSFGEPTPTIRRLMECGKESLRRGVKTLAPGNTYRKWAEVVEGHVEGECGFHLIRGLGGHGIGRALHGSPFVSNTLPTHPAEWPDGRKQCMPGTLIAVEPMIAVGTGETRQESIGKLTQWPVFTADGSVAVHYEHDVLITEHGPKLMTEGMDELPDVIAL